MNAANLNRKNRDATGIGACACARHGCFVPHTVVDFQKGERYALITDIMYSMSLRWRNRQMNIDYAICNALKYRSHGLLQALIIYDIGCQWIIHFLRRLKASRHLSIPEAIELLVAVGKFHLSAHVQECFVKYSLNFIFGSGQLDGEILETLWSPFNSISASARTMSLASRQQLYDDHMRDSNWKKMVALGVFHYCNNMKNVDHNPQSSCSVSTLRRKYEKARKGVQSTSVAYREMTSALKGELVEKWKKDEEKAMIERGNSLKIYDVKLPKGMGYYPGISM